MKWTLITTLLFATALCSNWQEKIEKESQIYGDWWELLSLISEAESSYNPYTNSWAYAHGAHGFRRIAIDHVNELANTNFTKVDMYNYKKSTYACYIFMQWHLKEWGGNLYMALASYNAGKQKVLDEGVIDHNYPRKILRKIKVFPKEVKLIHNEGGRQMSGLTYHHRCPNLRPSEESVLSRRNL